MGRHERQGQTGSAAGRTRAARARGSGGAGRALWPVPLRHLGANQRLGVFAVPGGARARGRRPGGRCWTGGQGVEGRAARRDRMDGRQLHALPARHVGQSHRARRRLLTRARRQRRSGRPNQDDDLPRSYASLTLEDAKRMLSAAEAKAASLGIAYNIAVVDAGGHLVTFVRQDGALIGSIDLAIDKALTARIFNKSTSDLASMAQSGKPLFGIQESNAGRVVIFGGGIPVMFDGGIVGAVGASAGTVEQDIAVAEAAKAALVAED